MPQLKLHELDNVPSLFNPTITVTFYRGVPSIDHFRSRIQEIVCANPWLSGYLSKTNNEIFLTYDLHPPLSNAWVSVIQDNSLNEKMSYYQIRDKLLSRNILKLKSGADSIKSLSPMFQCTLIEISDNKFAILFGTCHGICDGYTMYQLFGMLSPTRNVYSMNITRPSPIVTNKIKDYFKLHDTISFLSSLGFILNCLVMPFFHCTSHICYINQNYIDQEKQMYKNSLTESNHNNFISLNDIITSWLFNTCKCRAGHLVLNIRSRIMELTDKHAGNYISPLLLCPPDYAHPSLIRRSLALSRRCITGELALPGFWETIRGVRYTTITNWVSISTIVDLPNCTQLLHLPITKCSGLCNEAFIFKPLKDKVAILVFSRTIKASDLEREGILSMSERICAGDEDEKKRSCPFVTSTSLLIACLFIGSLCKCLAPLITLKLT